MIEINAADARGIKQLWPRCIHLAGADGTGKTTQARSISDHLRRQGLRVRRVWLRFPRFFSIPFLVFARLMGYSRREVVNRVEHGYWHFEESWVMSKVFPWALLFDTFLVAFLKVYLPLWAGYIVVCDRFVVDIMTDLMLGIKKLHFPQSKVGRLFLSILPEDTAIVILDLETELARARSPELQGDRSQAQRRRIYLKLAQFGNYPVISARAPADVVRDKLIAAIVKGTPGAGTDAKVEYPI